MIKSAKFNCAKTWIITWYHPSHLEGLESHDTSLRIPSDPSHLPAKSGHKISASKMISKMTSPCASVRPPLKKLVSEILVKSQWSPFQYVFCNIFFHQNYPNYSMISPKYPMVNQWNPMKSQVSVKNPPAVDARVLYCWAFPTFWRGFRRGRTDLSDLPPVPQRDCGSPGFFQQEMAGKMEEKWMENGILWGFHVMGFDEDFMGRKSGIGIYHQQ